MPLVQLLAVLHVDFFVRLNYDEAITSEHHLETLAAPSTKERLETDIGFELGR